jgi:FAD/FMN-containing dehydrogenase
MSLVETLRKQLPVDRFLEGDARGPEPDRDLCRYPLGTPACWIRPRSIEEVATVIRHARAARTSVVAVGQRTSYWRPLNYEGAVVLDTSGLDAVGAVESEHVWCGAGARVRDVDRALAAAGAWLVAQPDAFGDTSVGSMVAVDMRAGIGMGEATIDSMCLGLRVVLGTGEVLTTGTAAVLGAPAFTRAGLPDPTSLFFASDGALGIIAEVAIRRVERRARAQLGFDFSDDGAGWDAMVKLASRLRGPGLQHTFRAVAERGTGEPRGAGRADIVISSAWDEAELDARVAKLRAALAGVAIDERRVAAGDPARLPAWPGAVGEHWQRLASARFVGVDVIAPWSSVSACMKAVDEILDDAARLPALSLRRALYFAPDYVNVGVHLAFAPEVGVEADSVVARGMRALSGQPVVPYRWGRLWGDVLGERLDPTYRSTLAALKRVFDPDGILHPGATIFGRDA